MTPPRSLRIALIAVAAVIVIAVGAGAIFLAQFDPNTLKPRIIEAVKRATGRTLTMNGKISLKPSLWPTIDVRDVAFANPPGFTRPQMATLQSLDLQLALLPLLSSRIEIDRLLLIHPDILLEMTATGQSNWQLTPEIPPNTPPAAHPATAAPQPTPAGTKTTTAVSMDAIVIRDGTLAYRDDATGKAITIGIPRLDAHAASPDAPLHLNADAIYNGTRLNVTADTGGLTRLREPAATTPWPVKLALTVGAAKLTADGSMTKPVQTRGYDLTVNGTIPDAAALTPLLRGFVPPPLHNVTFAARIADTGGKLPDFSTLTLHVGASDLGTLQPGLALEKLDINAPNADQPVKIDAAAKLRGAPITVVGSFGPPALLMPGAKPAPFPVDVTVQAAGATAAAKGTIADAKTLAGANIALTAQIPDLSALSPLTRQLLPALKTIAFQGSLTDANGGLRHGAALHGFALTSPDGDLSGDATIGFEPRKTLTATLNASRIDLDAIHAATSPSTTPPSAAAPPPSNAHPAPGLKPPPRRDNRLFSDQPIPLNDLRAADANLRLKIADLHTAGTDYKAIDTHLVLSNGKLNVDPFAADLPAGHMSGNLTADTTQAAPPVHVILHAPGLALKTILAAFHQPSYATGNLEVYANLGGTGDSPHAIAASLDGSLGLAMAGGTLDNRLLGSLLGKVMDSLNALNLVGKGGNSELKCFGLRIDAKHGDAAIKPLVLSSSLLTMTGIGTMNLGAETLAMALRPQARIAGTSLVIPIAVSGPIRDPSVKVNDLGAAEANAGTVAGVVLGNATPLGIVGGLLGADKLLGGGTTDICAPALAAARGQPIPPASPAPASPARPEQLKAQDPGALLKKLFR